MTAARNTTVWGLQPVALLVASTLLGCNSTPGSSSPTGLADSGAEQDGYVASPATDAGGELDAPTADAGHPADGGHDAADSGLPDAPPSGDGSLPATSWPSATNTGYSGALTAAPNGPLSAAGTYSRLQFTNGVAIAGSNITLSNCLINTGGSNQGVYVSGNLTNVVIKNCTIVGDGDGGPQGQMGVYITGSGFAQVTIDACNISSVAAGVELSDGNVTLENSYIWGFASNSSHDDGVFFGGGGSPGFSLLVRHNTIINALTQTDATMIQNYFGPVNNVTINDNWLQGGGWTVYVDGSKASSNPITNVSVTDNAIVHGIFGYFDADQGSLGNADFQVTVSGNYDGHTNAPVSD